MYFPTVNTSKNNALSCSNVIIRVFNPALRERRECHWGPIDQPVRHSKYADLLEFCIKAVTLNMKGILHQKFLLWFSSFFLPAGPLNLVALSECMCSCVKRKKCVLLDTKAYILHFDVQK